MSAIQLSLRLYRILVLLYPAEFRREFAGEMVNVFAEQLDEAFAEPGNAQLLSIWSCALREIVTIALPMQLGNAVFVACAGSLVGTSAIYLGLLWALTNRSNLHGVVQRVVMLHLR